MSDEFWKYIEDHYHDGFTNRTLLAKMAVMHFNMKDTTVEKVRRSVSKYLQKQDRKINNPALDLACQERGIDISTVGIAWQKDKKWSIQFKPSANEGPSFEEMLKDHIDDVKKHTFKYEEIKREKHPSSNLLVIDPADIHIGKLATSFETGEDYNSQIAVKRVKDGVQGILDKSS